MSKANPIPDEKTLLGRQKDYSKQIHELHMTEGWWWDVPGFKPRPDQPTEPTSPVVPSDKEDATLYSITDSPVIEKLGLYREQRKTPAGEIEHIGWITNTYEMK